MNMMSWTKGSSENLVIVVKNNAPEDDSFSRFTGVKIDEYTLIRDSDYTVSKGSTIVKILPKALEGLKAGEHNASVEFDNGKTDIKITITDSGKVPDKGGAPTGDPNRPKAWAIALILAAAALAAIIVVILFRRKRS